MRGVVTGVLVAVLVCAVPGTAAAAVQRRFVANFNSPVQVTAPSWMPGSVLYVAEKGGRIVRYANGDRSVVLDIRGRVSTGGEQGLLSIAFRRRFRRMFVYYTNASGDGRVGRWTLRPGGKHVVVGSGKILLKVRQPFDNHNGGTLQFRGGHLYLSLGDGGSGCDPDERAQNLRTRLGKLLRQDKDGWKIIGYGLRNPWRWSFDRATGDLYLGDVGQDSREELDFLPALKVALPRENFGWDKYEGSLANTCENDGLKGAGALVFPRLEYSHSLGFTVIGGYVYRGSAMPAQRGRYFFGDLQGWVRSADARTLRNRRLLGFQVPSLVSFGENSNGELYAVSLDGPVYRLVDK
jgi:glucose/arabinose dehydrogenase